jgi:hypothetical protein
MLKKTEATTETATPNGAVIAGKGQYLKVRPSQLTIIGVDTEDGPEHPLYDERINLPLDPDMVANIRHHGVLEVIQAVKDGERLIVWAGRQRTRHARIVEAEMAKAGEGDFTVNVLATKDSQVGAFQKGLVSNRFRTNDDVLTSARQAKKALDLGATIQSIASDMKVSDQTIRNWVQLLSASPEVIAAVEAQDIGATSALVLAALPQAEQGAQLDALKEDAKTGVKLTASETKNRVQARKAGEQPAKKATPKERVDKAVILLTKLAMLEPKEQTKEALMEGLNKLSRALAGKSFDKLVVETEE